VLQPPLRRNCCGRCIRLPRPRLSPIRPWPVVVKQNPYDSAHGQHVEHCGNAHLKDQVDRRLDSDDHQEREHGTEEKDGGNRPFRPGPKVTHRWTIAGLLTGAIVRHRPSKTRWPRPERGQKHVGGSAGLVPGALARDGEGNVGIGGGVRFSGLARCAGAAPSAEPPREAFHQFSALCFRTTMRLINLPDDTLPTCSSKHLSCCQRT
jgi:hypothetical protein